MDVADKQKKKRVWQIGCGILFIVGVVVAIPVIDVYFDLRREGFLDETKKKEYEGTSMDNLRALHQAVSLYYESEGIMPMASGWMDAASTYVKTADLKKGEELKKFVNPRLPAGDDVFGYAFNSVFSQVYLDEVEDLATLALIFESKDSSWNAFGDPQKLQPNPELDGGNKAVTAEGAAVTLKELLESAGKSG